jgi:hypothetical protein
MGLFVTFSQIQKHGKLLLPPKKMPVSSPNDFGESCSPLPLLKGREIDFSLLNSAGSSQL